jgi:hypothetical protein
MPRTRRNPGTDVNCPTSATGASRPNLGAWVPWLVAERIPRLDLRPPSRWRVFIAVLMTAARYGRGEAHLAVDDLVTWTNLSKRTVKAALADLIEQGLVERVGRYGNLRVPWLFGELARNGTDPATPTALPNQTGGANIVAPPDTDEARTGGASLCAPPLLLLSLY